MKILILTSCTGKKAVNPDNTLTKSDFQLGADVVSLLETERKDQLLPAAHLYTGEQHLRLMKGIKDTNETNNLEVNLHILSAGYGMIPAKRKILPYEITFATMKKKELTEWAQFLNVPNDFREVVAKPYGFGLILLGDNYLEACDLDDSVQFGGPTLLFCGTAAARKLPKYPNVKVVTLSNPEAKRMSCGLVALKGELGARILRKLATIGDEFASILMNAESPLELLEEPKINTPAKKKVKAIVNPAVNKIITLPEDWVNSSHKSEARYFIPDWDDLVDPDFDFINEVHSGGAGNWNNQVYAHQIYPTPSYDGILVSRVVVDENKKRRELMEELGVHGSLRVPDSFPVMGDCGAFGYLMEEVPPYSTENVLDYYTRYGFNLGVSVDHLIVNATMTSAKERYELTIHNAEDFLKEHRKAGLIWRPIGAVQGWDPKSYAAAAEKYVKMGYDYIALGGLVRTNTAEVLKIVEEVSKVVPRTVDVHLFGLARLEAMRTFSKLGITSVDSASHLRRAWLGATDNYWTMGGKRYAAIRIPQPSKKLLAKHPDLGEDAIIKMEQACLEVVRKYDKGFVSLTDTLDILDAYDQVAMGNRKSLRKHYERTLIDKPWKQCPCDICRKDGVEVIIFRGNNRNRRRGFHNTFIFYSLLRSTLIDKSFFVDDVHQSFELDYMNSEKQLALFE